MGMNEKGINYSMIGSLDWLPAVLWDVPARLILQTILS